MGKRQHRRRYEAHREHAQRDLQKAIFLRARLEAKKPRLVEKVMREEKNRLDDGDEDEKAFSEAHGQLD